MLTGDQLFQARTSAGMTQQQLANTLGVSLRSVGNWERSEQVPRSAETKVWKLLGAYLLEDQHPSVSSDLAHVSDARLLAEIARRFELGRREVGSDDRSAPTSKPDIVRTQNVTVELDEGADVTHLPSAQALDPSLPDDIAARDEKQTSKTQRARERQDKETEGP